MNKVIESKLQIVVYTVKDLQDIFKCGKNVAYGIMNSDGFPSFKINKRLFVYNNLLDKWLVDNRGNELTVC